MKNLAIFDLDNTLINTDSDHAWPQYLMAKGLVDVAENRKTERKNSTATTKTAASTSTPSSPSTLRR